MPVTNKKTAVLVIGTKHCGNYREFEFFLNWCLELWQQNVNNLVFVTEEQRGADYLVRTFLTNKQTEKVESFESNYKDVICNWDEHGKMAGVIKNKELIKLTLKNTHIKETPKVLLYLDDTSHPDLIINKDRWSVQLLIEAALKEGFELYCYHPSTTEKISEQKQFEQEISDEDNQILKSAKQLAKAMKGNVVEEKEENVVDYYLDLLKKNNPNTAQELQKQNNMLDWEAYDPDEIPF